MFPKPNWDASEWGSRRGSRSMHLKTAPFPERSSRSLPKPSLPRKTCRLRKNASLWSSASRSAWTIRKEFSSPACPPTPRSYDERWGALMTEYAVITEGLTRRFGTLTAVDHLDLHVKAGELYGFLGPNGAGKSTTLRMLCGILEPSDGNGTVLGIDLRRDPERVKSAIGYMSQKFSLYDDLTAEENLTFYARAYMVPRSERAARTAQMIRLADLSCQEKKQARFLSGGYRQRLALACALRP